MRQSFSSFFVFRLRVKNKKPKTKSPKSKFAERLSEKKIEKILNSKQQRQKYEQQQRKELKRLAWQRRRRCQDEDEKHHHQPSGTAPSTMHKVVNKQQQQQQPRRSSRRSISQGSLSPSHSSGYGSNFGSDERENKTITSLKRRRSSNISSQDTPVLKRTKTNAGLIHIKKPKGEYIVESIERVEVVNYQPVFYVKWFGYNTSENTWENLMNLKDCAQLEHFVEQQLHLHEKYVALITRELEAQLATEPNELELSKLGITMEQVENYDNLQLHLDLILLAQYRASGSRAQREPERIGERALQQMRVQRYYYERRKQLKLLEQFESYINSVEYPAPPIRVCNDVDLDTIETSFNYIQHNVLSDAVPQPETDLFGCTCCTKEGEGKQQTPSAAGMCAPSSRCCARLAGELFAYERSTRRLRLPQGSAIYECNKRCSCDDSCTNRLVQNGRKHPLELFKTNNGRGWGVRTPQALRKGEFVCEYVGEIITSDEANERGKHYDDKGRTYLFDLDYNTAAESEYTIDAAMYGNVSHFINHSCDPNLAVFPCWIEHLNMALPHLVFFTLRPIKAGEELSFDYIRADNEDVPYENLSMAARVECRCGAANCRKVLF